MKPVDVKSNTYIDLDKENIRKFLIESWWLCKNIKIWKRFCKRLRSKLVRRSSVIKNVKNTVPLTYVISDLNGKKIVGTFYEKELQKTN